LGIDNLIEAIQILNNRNVCVRLKIYGDGEYRTEITKMISNGSLTNIIDISDSFISLEKLSMELDKAHIGVIPLPSNVSNDIAMPVKIYEFFAKKVCVVATELDLLKNCFDNTVVFFNERNSEDLADKLEYLYYNRNIIREYAERGYAKFKSQTWEFYKNKYQLLLKN
jgi:glycosyltransferase involved in cell wall biosynthesis